MDNSYIWKISIILVMMIFSALFSGTETAYSCVNRVRLKNYEAQGNKKAKTALKLANKYDEVLTAVLIGNNIVNIGTSAVATVLFCSIFGDSGAVISTIVITVMVLVFCEVLPKSYAKKNAEKISLAFAGALSALVTILKPFVWILNRMSSVFKAAEEPTFTEDELKYMIDEIEEEGVIEEQESELVKSALDFDEKIVDDILIPRVKIVGVEISSTIDEIRDIFTREMYSRLPVYEKSLDNIVGIITNKSFFKMLMDDRSDIRSIIQEVPHIAETNLISQAMRSIQRTKVHLAVVTDEYGGTKGIVTLEDIIEELVGEIYDEDDEIITNIVKLDESRYEAAGDTEIADLLEMLELDEAVINTECTTVGGWITDIAQHIPDAGEVVDSGNFRLTAVEVNEHKVEKVLIEMLPSESDEDEAED